MDRSSRGRQLVPGRPYHPIDYLFLLCPLGLQHKSRIIFLAELTCLLIALIIPNVGMGENGHTRAHWAG